MPNATRNDQIVKVRKSASASKLRTVLLLGSSNLFYVILCFQEYYNTILSMVDKYYNTQLLYAIIIQMLLMFLNESLVLWSSFQ